MVEPNLLSVALLTPASDPVFGDPNAIIDLIFARAGSDAINGYDPGSNDGTRVDDFELDESDKIQLHGNPDDYSLGIDLPDLEKGTAIFLGSNQNDLIGIVKDVKDIMLTDTSIFNFA